MPLTQLPCDVSQLQAGREAVQSVFSYAAAVLKCTTCLSWLPNLGTWYTESFHTPGVILEIVVDLDTFILALKTRECRNQLFGRRQYDACPGSCFHPGWQVLSINVCTVSGGSQYPTGTCSTLMESVPCCPSIFLPPTHTPFGAHPVFIPGLGLWVSQLEGDLWRKNKPSRWKTIFC